MQICSHSPQIDAPLDCILIPELLVHIGHKLILLHLPMFLFIGPQLVLEILDPLETLLDHVLLIPKGPQIPLLDDGHFHEVVTGLPVEVLDHDGDRLAGVEVRLDFDLGVRLP
jgi:hypothetical protein